MSTFRPGLRAPGQHTVPRLRLLAIGACALAFVTAAAPSLTPAAAAAERRPRPSADASTVTDWTVTTMNAVAADPTKTSQSALLYIAFVDAAMYDAVVGIDGRYQPYLLRTRGPRHASDVAAAATAAHEVLRTYVPTQAPAVDAQYATSLAAVPDGPAKTRGIAYGLAAAHTLLASRVDDGRDASILFTQPPAVGVWRPTPPASSPMASPWLGFVRPLMLRSGSQFGEPGPPPALTSARYTRDFRETKAYGSATSTARSPEQTATALFFSGGVLVQDVTALVDQVQQRRLDLVDAARVFAGVTMSMADTLVSVWHAKYHYGFWRPITAIREAGSDGNPATVADPTWTPLLTTPPYPDYVSGYSGLTGAFSTALQIVLGTPHLRLNLMSTAVPVVRDYDSGAALRRDVVDGRVWLGIHFRTADLRGVAMGRDVARWALARYLRPLDD
jgi:hypothetical protein